MAGGRASEHYLRDLARLCRVRDRIDREYAYPLDGAASGNGSGWPPTWPRRAASTFSTSRPAVSTSPTWSSGRIVFEGTPADLVAARSTLTGEHLAACVGT